MQIPMYLYLETNLIGIIILLVMYHYISRLHMYPETHDQKYFLVMLAMNSLILLLDDGIYLLRGHNYFPLIVLNHFVCCLYFVFHSWFCYFWIQYIIAKLYPRHRQKPVERILLAMPSVITSVIVFCSPFNGWVYYISGDNRYHRGPFLWILFAAGLLYAVVNTVIIVREMVHPAMSREKGTYMALLLFPLPPIIGNILQLRFNGLSIVWICMAITLLILFVDLQNDLLSRDAVTGLYNRRQANTQLTWEIQHLRQSSDFLFVAMVDVDHFKLINDEYGHITGDRALSAVGEILRRSCRKNDFISRFGGDEFLITGHIRDESDTAIILNRITESTAKKNRTEDLPCTLSLSIGTAVFSRSSVMTMDSVINEADERMYEAKKANHIIQQTASCS
jgi:diguanylate cyclase (GGDEF)-like protein